MDNLSQSLFEAVAQRDHDALLRIYGQNALDALSAYSTMRRRWGARSAADGKYYALNSHSIVTTGVKIR
jgi:hypothetical protein